MISSPPKQAIAREVGLRRVPLSHPRPALGDHAARDPCAPGAPPRGDLGSGGQRGSRRQNSLPSGSRSTTHSASSGCPTAARVAPLAMRSSTAAAWSSAYKSRCRPVLGQLRVVYEGEEGDDECPSGDRTSTPAGSGSTKSQPRVCAHHRARDTGCRASMVRASHQIATMANPTCGLAQRPSRYACNWHLASGSPIGLAGGMINVWTLPFGPPPPRTGHSSPRCSRRPPSGGPTAHRRRRRCPDRSRTRTPRR